MKPSASSSRGSGTAAVATSEFENGSFSPEYRRRSLEYSPEGGSQKKYARRTNLDNDEDNGYNGLLGLNGRCNITPQVPLKQNVFHIGHLPVEVLQQIFGHISMLDLLFAVNRVCKNFHQAVEDPVFLRWKKLYYKYRCTTDGSYESEINSVLEAAGIVSLDGSLKKIFLFIQRSFRKCSPNQREDMLLRIRTHPRYLAAESWVTRCLTSDLGQEMVASVWLMISVVVVLCENVDEICSLFKLAMASAAVCGNIPGEKRENSQSESVIPTAECFYCLGTLCLACHRRWKVSPKLHYSIFTAVSFCEMVWNFMPPAQGNLRLTFEQEKIVSYTLAPNDCIRIVAYAGSGKTTTLIEYTRAHPNLKILVLMFNKAVQQEAEKRFPRNATCKTVHSIAWLHIFKKGHKRENIGNGNLNVKTVLLALPRDKKGFHKFWRARVVAETLKNFCNSSDAIVDVQHVPAREQIRHKDNWEPVTPERKRQYVSDAEEVWKKMKDPNDPLCLPHEVYLKLFQLDCPNFTSGYQALLIDEAQDMNPAVLDALLRQNIPKIFVGDPYQQIYSFCGAVNALGQISHTRTFFLTQSFRFGPDIGFLANCWLEEVKGVRKKLLIGSEKTGSLERAFPANVPVTIIARRNDTIFDHCVKLVNENPPRRIRIVGGLANLRLNDIHDVYLVMLTPEQRDDSNWSLINERKFGGFSGWEQLHDYAENYMDMELLATIRIAKKYSDSVLQHIQKIQANHMDDENLAEYLLSTAHKAKGREFHIVALADDFMTLDEMRMRQAESFETRRICEDEFNLLYVALTRAKEHLIMNHALYEFLRTCVNESYEIPNSWSRLREKLPIPLRCFACGEEIKEQEQLLLYRREIALVKRHASQMKLGKLSSGSMCPNCKRQTANWRYRFEDDMGQMIHEHRMEEERNHTGHFLRDIFE